MHFCLQLHDWFQQDSTVTTVDSASTAPQRRKPPKRRSSGSTAPPPPSRIPAEELAAALKPHILSPKRMWALGYPLELEPNSTKAIVYSNPPPRPSRPLPFTTWDVNAPEFVPGGAQNDSGRGSWGSSPRDSDEEPDAVDSVEHSCVRCEKKFKINNKGEYLKEEMCIHHWGRVNIDSVYSCCNLLVGSRGCVASNCHVWNGIRPGMNGPLEGYVRARSPRGGVYAIDAEMCYTTAGLELASIAVIAAHGHLVYRALVLPNSPVVDYNTRFSGIRSRDMSNHNNLKTLRQIQNDLLGFIGTDTILVGHALENDLRALKLIHNCVVDTSDLYPHPRGYPLRRSLRTLAEELLGRQIQRGCHSPSEDARAAMDLVLVKVHEERAAAAAAATGVPRPIPYAPRVSGMHAASSVHIMSTSVHRGIRPPMYRTSNQLPVLQPYDPLVSAA